MFSKWLVFLFLISTSVGAAFFPQTDDIPLMGNMTLQEKNTVTFDTPAGQILSYTVQTAHKPDSVRSFYHNTLTALGWIKESKNVYTRGSDRFQMTFLGNGQVKFDITLSSVN